MPQYQDGDRRFGRVRRNGLWVQDDEPQGNPRPLVSAPPPQPTPMTRDQAAAGAYDPQIKAAQLEGIRLENDKRRREAAMAGDGGGLAPRGDVNKVGEDYLKTLPPADAGMLRAMSEGRMGLPSGYAMRSPKAMQLLAELHQYDPTADAANLPSRIKMRTDATSGSLGKTTNSFNTALGHMGSLAQAIEGLDNFGGSTALTSVVNYGRNTALSNRPELARFAAARKAVADELAKAFAGTQGAVSDREHWLEVFSENKSPKALRASIAEAANLLSSKIQASEDQYNLGMGTTGKGLPMLHGHAKDALAGFQSPDYLEKGYGALGGQGPSGGPRGGPGGGGPRGPIDPTGTGYIGAEGAPDPYQSQILPVADEGRQRFNAFVGTLKPGQYSNDDLAAVLEKKWQEETGRPLMSARGPKGMAAYFNQTGKFSSDIQYKPVGELRDQIGKDKAHQALIDAQDISDARGGRSSIGNVVEGVGAGLRGAANMISYGGADKFAARLDTIMGKGDYTNNLARQEKIGQYDSQHHFIPQLAGSALGLAGNEAGVARLGRFATGASPTIARIAAGVPESTLPALNDATYGAIYGAVNTDGSAGDRAMGALEGAGATALGGMAGRSVGRGVGRALTGTRDAATIALNKAGVPLTMGQIAGRGGIVGKTVKAAEDAFESIPVLGAAIRARRQEGIEAFNRGTFDQALAPIGATTQDQIGEQGVESAKGAVSAAYTKALKNVDVTVKDKVFARNLSRVIGYGQRLHPEVAKDFEILVRDQLAPVVAKGNMTGVEFQALQQVIRQEQASWAGKPRGNQYGNVLKQLDQTLESLVRRQAPGTAPALKAANRAYRLSKVAEDAVKRGVNTEGVFTPAQLGTSAVGSGRKYGNSAATSERPFYDYQRAGQQVLPSKMPNSGTFDRAAYGAIVPTVLGGAGYEAGMSPEHIGAMMALGLPFTKAGQASFKKLLIDRPDVVKRAGEQLLNSRRVRGLFGAGGVYGAAPATNWLLSD
jgi:hypothetical protein